MQENTKGQTTDKDRNQEQDSKERLRDQVGYQGSSSGSGDAGLDEKTSTMGRRDQSSGLTSKDGLTGSDLDGQVS